MADLEVSHPAAISVVIPVFNGEKFLGAALGSVLAQGEKILEILVVDDGSQDRSAELAQSFPKVRLLSQDNLGPAAARNLGIAAARGQWLAFIDCDDLWSPVALEKLLASFSDSKVEMVVGQMRPISEPSTLEGDLEFLGPASPNFGFGVSLIRREVFQRVGPLNPEFRRGEDTEWCMRAREAGVRIQLIPDVVLYNRRHGSNLTRESEPSLTLKLVKESLDRRRREGQVAALPSLHRTTKPSATPEEYFASAEALFDKACRNDGLSRQFRIGGGNLRIRFAHPILAEKVVPALAHLEDAESADVEGEILVWDSASTGVAMLPPPWKFEYYLGKGEVKAFSNDRFFTAYQHGPDALNLWDDRRSKGIFWVRDARDLPLYESGAPLRYLLQYWALSRGQQLIHAAAVGHPESALLITGKGGLGKSTTAASALFSKLRFAGDDYVLLDPSSRPTAFSLFATAKLNADSLRWLPGLQPWIVNPQPEPDEKFFAFLHPGFRERLAPSLSLRAIAIPSVGGRPGFERISAVECLKALAPSTLVQLPKAGKAAFEGLCAAVRALPCYRFHLGTDPRLLPHAMEEFLA